MIQARLEQIFIVLLFVLIVCGCSPKSTLEVTTTGGQTHDGSDDVNSVDANQIRNESPNPDGNDEWETITPPDLSTTSPLQVNSFRVASKLVGLADPVDTQTYVVVELSVPPGEYWSSSSGSFFTGPEPANLTTDVGNVQSSGYAIPGSAEFKTTKQSVFLPESPTENENVSFAFLVLKSSLEQPLQIQYGTSKPIELTADQKAGN